MQYLGGKEKISKQITSFLESQREPEQLFVDLTVGGCSIISKMSYPKKGYDKHPALISLYKSLSNTSLELPDIISYEQYKEARSLDDGNPLKAFIGFGCSYSGRYFEGYAKNSRGNNFARSAKNSLLKKFKTLKNVEFVCADLFDLDFDNCLIYIDPPYTNSKEYTVKFDYNKFWDKVRQLSKKNKVFVSEYKAPNDFECVLEIKKRLGLRTKSGGQEIRIEKLFTIKDIL